MSGKMDYLVNKMTSDYVVGLFSAGLLIFLMIGLFESLASLIYSGFPLSFGEFSVVFSLTMVLVYSVFLLIGYRYYKNN